MMAFKGVAGANLGDALSLCTDYLFEDGFRAQVLFTQAKHLKFSKISFENDMAEFLELERKYLDDLTSELYHLGSKRLIVKLLQLEIKTRTVESKLLKNCKFGGSKKLSEPEIEAELKEYAKQMNIKKDGLKIAAMVINDDKADLFWQLKSTDLIRLTKVLPLIGYAKINAADFDSKLLSVLHLCNSLIEYFSDHVVSTGEQTNLGIALSDVFQVVLKFYPSEEGILDRMISELITNKDF